LLLSLLLQSGLLLLPLNNRAHREICGDTSPKLLVHESARAKVTTIHSTAPRQLLLLLLLLLRLLVRLLLLLVLMLMLLLLLLTLLLHEE
jgi:hypothetical protein